MSEHTTRARKAQAVWTDEESFATTLLLLAIDTYGTELTRWTPETIRCELEEDFNVKLPRVNLEKLLAAISLITTDEFYKSLPDFVVLCNTLNGEILDPSEWDRADAGELAWGITEAALIWPPEGDEPFVQDILAYIGATLDDEGIINPPDILRLALRPQGLATRIQEEYSDDPAMFSAIYGVEQRKTAWINSLIRANLRQLSDQLRGLPLSDGNAVEAVRTLLSNMQIGPSAAAADTAPQYLTL